ncbi:MAG: GNAT family N-acetyltransferase [Arcobacter sp.]|jgi:RimJ/RimL family protein N-acetyltransferase|uniref:GNAT family N-acetyltransferase n=1 Tax=Arcobacter sp. TaxID=1872629 RepID=UPI003C71186B|tara:strand:+ start:18755 stop:19261 length:507 start_codon:yes stop_codon:yes gene_type:complete
MNIIETDRLILRTIILQDINDLYKQVFFNEDVVKFTFGSDGLNIDETKDFIKNNCNFDKKLGLSTLVEKISGRIIGLAGNIECNYLEKKDYEFGFILGKEFWGKGYATEIGKAQINFIKNELKGKRVLALVHKDNVDSIKTIEKLGLSHLTTVSTNDRGNRELYIKNF